MVRLRIVGIWLDAIQIGIRTFTHRVKLEELKNLYFLDSCTLIQRGIDLSARACAHFDAFITSCLLSLLRHLLGPILDFEIC